MENEYIKPCPFCGCERVEVSRTNPEACWIQCDPENGCGAESQTDPTRAGAIRNWNRRAANTGRKAIVVHDMELPRGERVAHYERHLVSTPAT